MAERRFYQAVRVLASVGSRRGLLRWLQRLPLVGLLALTRDASVAGARGRTAHHHRSPDHHTRTQRRKDRRQDARAEACIPTGKPCPSKKPRGHNKHGKARKLSCHRCCQRHVTTVNGQAVCACQPNTMPCTDTTECCLGVCTNGACVAATTCPACSGTTPICQGDTCVACTSSSQCPSGQLCLEDGSCQACDVLCPTGSTPTACGATLQAAIAAGGTYFLCPGRYQGNFTASVAVSLIGAGEGTDPASDSILDANGSGRVLAIPSGVGPVELRRLRVTDGNSPGNFPFADGGGIAHLGTILRMTDCTVAGNTVVGFGGGLFVDNTSTLEMMRCTVRDNLTTLSGAVGGGMFTQGTMTLTDCLVEANRSEDNGGGIVIFNETTTLSGTTQVRDNHADAFPTSFGGGILLNFGTLTIAETCRVTHNTAADGFGGGIWNQAGTATLQGANPSPIVVDNCHQNCAGPGGVPKCAPTPISCP